MLLEVWPRMAIPLLCALVLVGSLTGCSSCSSEQENSHSVGTFSAKKAEPADESSSEASALDSKYERIRDEVKEFANAQESSIPIRASIGDTIQATENLSVSVLSVETGPYDYFDKSPTVRVEVQMNNLSDKVITVKASNWDADNTDGQRVEHKLWVKDAKGLMSERSFEITRISPHASFVGIIYFDGNGLVDVVYEPHWLVSPQNQFIYFDV